MRIITVISFVLLVSFDQIAKYFCFHYLKQVDTIEILSGILNFTYVENRGAAFGMMQGARWFFVIFTIILVGVMMVFYKKLSNTTIHKMMKISLVLIISGAIGNWIDRLFLGYVIDFLHVQFIEFPVFNLADIYVVCGTILFSILYLFFDSEQEAENAESIESIESIENIENIENNENNLENISENQQNNSESN